MFMIGIDPGKQGALALVGKKRIYQLTIVPLTGSGEYDIDEMFSVVYNIFHSKNDIKAVIERQAAQPIQGVKSAFNMGYGFGIWETLLLTIGIPYEVVKPKEWQKEMFKGLSPGERKNTKSASAQIAKRLFPKQDFTKSERARKDHDGMTDAVCIAVYGRRKVWR